MTATLTVTAGVLDHLVRAAAATASDIDAGRLPATTHLRAVVASGLLDAEIDAALAGRAASDVGVSAEVLAALAGECVPTAFALWAHRVVTDYLARGVRTPATDAALARLRRADAVGATGMAQALKALAGIGELGIDATPAADGGFVLTGFVSWISNLVADAVVVLPARLPDGRGIVVWLPLATPGLVTRPVTGLLALDATASGTLRLDGVHVPADQVLSTDLAGFVRAVKPTFLVLQTSFAAGLVRRSWSAAEDALDRGENAVFGADAAALGAEVADFLARWRAAASDLAAVPIRDLLRLRLDAARLATRVTRLEATLAGGRAYQAASAANRRFREAAFLPVQSPSEGHLLWELSSLA
nr:acyl-CoA/acyl-ACP dehydrogenase [Propionibacterium sp.]